jgi:hypothetical protein
MFQVEDRFKLRLGGNTYINCKTLVEYKGESLFTLKRHDENDYLGIYFDIYNANGERIAAVKRNEIYYGDKEAFEIDGSLNRYVFTEKATGQVICDIRKREDAHPAELDVSVHLYTPSGFLFDATPEQTNLGGMVLRGNTVSDCGTGIVVR